ALCRERGHVAGGGLHVVLELEANACCAKRLAVAIDEDGFVIGARLAPQQRLEHRHRFRPYGGKLDSCAPCRATRPECEHASTIACALSVIRHQRGYASRGTTRDCPRDATDFQCLVTIACSSATTRERSSPNALRAL